jgi:hypothetical protein
MMPQRLIFAAALFAATPAIAQTAPAPATPPANPCADAQHHAFDFWVGKWDVTPFAGGPLVAHSLIESLYGGCAIRENWMPLKGTGGGSLSNYDSGDGKWHQTWVDSSGTRAVFDGEARDGTMVLTGQWRASGPKGEDGITRMTYSPQPGGAVRQKGEFSTDGKSWIVTFDFLYSPSK